MAIEHAPDRVRVNVVSLGPTETGLFKRLTDMAPDPEAVRAGVAQNLPMKRLGRVQEVCRTVSFLLSDTSGSFTSHAVLPLDGSHGSPGCSCADNYDAGGPRLPSRGAPRRW